MTMLNLKEMAAQMALLGTAMAGMYDGMVKGGMPKDMAERMVGEYLKGIAKPKDEVLLVPWSEARENGKA